MILWRDNKTDGRWECSVEQLADWYMDSEWPDRLLLVRRKLAAFMADDERVRSVWEENQQPEFERLLNLVIEGERRRDAQLASEPASESSSRE